jgi:hypothetical protein
LRLPFPLANALHECIFSAHLRIEETNQAVKS